MKKCIVLFLVMMIFSLTAGVQVFAAKDNVTVIFEGELIEFDQPPIIVDGRLLVPVRAIMEKIDATLFWDEITETVIITTDDVTLDLKVGSTQIGSNDNSVINIDVPPQIHNGRVLLPIRAVLEKFGYELQWNELDKIVTIEDINTTEALEESIGNTSVAVPSELPNTHVKEIRNWAAVSSLQQFSYKDEGLAYAYVKDNKLEITTPTRQLNIEMKCPLLGDVISDEDGNFYVVWGR